MRTAILGLCLSLMTFVSGAFAGTLTAEQKLSDFHFLVSIINAGYGPLEYKKTHGIVDPLALNARFEKEIAETKNNHEFYYKMVEYVASYQDGHFGLEVPTTKRVYAPVVTDLVDGRVLITRIDRDKLSETDFPFAVGDEIVSVGGKPVGEYLDATSKYIGSGNKATVRRVAAWTVFSRRSGRMPLPEGDVLKIEVRRGTSTLIEKGEVKWTAEGEDIEPAETLFGLMSSFPVARPVDFDRLDNEQMMAFVHPMADRDFICSGNTRTAIPEGATVIMKEPFVAYYHATAKGNVGYLRIPHYMPVGKPGENEIETTLNWISQYEFAISQLEKNTVGLIIDQDHNCGGSVWIVNKMISMFMDKPFLPSQFELLATKESYTAMNKWYESTAQNTLDRANVKAVVDLVKDTWLKGVSRLTPKIAIDGEQEFLPNTIRYTKPVVILIDEMAGSGGDMFPSMMKGLGRAKLFGQTTSGLGGHIQSYPAPMPYSQMTLRMTKSLFYRPDGVAVENNGAVVDQPYVITRDDMMYGFKGYQKAYVDYLLSFIP